jgi:hypothetical protein
MLPFRASTTSWTLLTLDNKGNTYRQRLIKKFNTFMFIYNILVSSCEKCHTNHLQKAMELDKSTFASSFV